MLKTVRDAAGNLTSIDSDAAGRRRTLADPDTGLTKFTYNSFGELVEQLDARNVTVQYTHDRLGRVTDKTASWPEVRDPSAHVVSPARVDPIARPYNAQSLNRYSYVRNRPLSLIDPSGYNPCDEYSNYCAGGGGFNGGAVTGGGGGNYGAGIGYSPGNGWWNSRLHPGGGQVYGGAEGSGGEGSRGAAGDPPRIPHIDNPTSWSGGFQGILGGAANSSPSDWSNPLAPQYPVPVRMDMDRARYGRPFFTIAGGGRVLGLDVVHWVEEASLVALNMLQGGLAEA